MTDISIDEANNSVETKETNDDVIVVDEAVFVISVTTSSKTTKAVTFNFKVFLIHDSVVK